jgi:DtxR family Mn-dependent transcriptional regulator
VGAIMKNNKLTYSMEDYLEAIYRLEMKNRVARITDIANMLNYKKSSVTKALKVLAEKELINYEPYKYITLKKAGMNQAKKIMNKHNVLKLFCEDILLLDPEEAEDIGCKMEHFISCENLQRFQDVIDFFNETPEIKKKWIDKEKPVKSAC